MKPPGPLAVTRRRFVQGAAGGGASFLWPRALTAAPLQDAWALEIAEVPVTVTGRQARATVANGTLPAPTLRFRQGEHVTIHVTNRLREPTSLHWHGLRLPAAMDGVPGLTFRGILPGETFTYRFPVVQTGTYWYHSHSGMQEQTGLYGALILEAAVADTAASVRDHVILLSDWTDQDPMDVVANLKQEGDYYSTDRPSLAGLAREARADGAGTAFRDRLRWEGMRMSPNDIADVTGATYTFLVNGKPPAGNFTALFEPGERVRLRFINASSMTTFDVRIPGLALTMIAADGSDIDPVTVDAFRIGVAETYDAIVTPPVAAAYTIFAQAEDRSGYARATLAPRPGMAGFVPAMDARPVRTMADMGMAMGGMKMAGMAAPVPAGNGMKNMPGMDMSGMRHASATTPPPPADDGMRDMPGMDVSGMRHASATPPPAPADNGMKDRAGIDMSGMRYASAAPPAPAPVHLAGKPDVDNVAAHPTDRLAEAGDGLPVTGRRTLTYADLKSRVARPFVPPSRDVVFHLTGNMERWVWGFDGKKFSEAGPVRVALGERVRFVLINDTMMEHPIHLHGFLFELENGQDGNFPLKHTVNVKPGERASFVFSADTPGHWAFHCHLLYHMETGMFRTILVA